MATQSDTGLEAATSISGLTQQTPLKVRTARNAAIASGGIPDGHETTSPRDEISPLLGGRSGEDGEDNGGAFPSSDWDGEYEWEGVPWYKRPSVYWLLVPFVFSAMAFGGILVPKVNLILNLICREYFAELGGPNSFLPSDLGEVDKQCRIPEVQARVARFTLYTQLISGVLSAIIAPRLGSLSDRYGRRRIMMLTSFGGLSGEVMTIFAAKFPETFPIYWLLVGAALDGLCGGMIASMALSSSYATDCTPPNKRNVVFGYFHGCLFTGIALGPYVAAKIIQWTGGVIVMFYVALGCHLVFVLLLILVIPESLSKSRQMAAREKHRQAKEEYDPGFGWQYMALNIFEPLKILYPKGPGTSPAVRRNLVLLASVDGIIFGVGTGAMTAVVLYSNYKFQWDAATQSYFISIVNSARVLCLMVVLPTLTKLFRPKATRRAQTGTDLFELSIIRLAIFFDMLGFLGYTLARSGPAFIASGTLASMGGIGSPTLQAALTKHVRPNQVGQLLGAMGLLHAFARVLAPTAFNSIYAATVGKFDQTVFVILTVLFSLAWLVSWFVRPGVRLEDVEEEYRRRQSSIRVNNVDSLGI